MLEKPPIKTQKKLATVEDGRLLRERSFRVFVFFEVDYFLILAYFVTFFYKKINKTGLLIIKEKKINSTTYILTTRMQMVDTLKKQN